MPLRIITATATSHPPAVPSVPLPASQGGSATSMPVPAAMQTSAATIATAYVRAVARPPSVPRIDSQVLRLVAAQSDTSAHGCAVDIMARLAEAPTSSRHTPVVASARRGATSTIAMSTVAT